MGNQATKPNAESGQSAFATPLPKENNRHG